MPHFQKKPLIVEAIEFKGTYQGDRELLSRLAKTPYRLMGRDNLQIRTLSGWQVALPGDFVLFGTHDVYPIKADVLHATYDSVPDPTPEP